MKGAHVLFFIGIWAHFGASQYLNNRPFPTYSLENMPDTQFSCRDKILGGYYADAETMCQMFHICVKVAGVGVQDFRFLCPNGTAFDQDHQICAEWGDVDCDVSTLYYSSDNFDLYRIGSGFESKPVKYGEDEEPFVLQRAETGDIRLNREHQSQRVNQQQQQARRNRPQNNNNNNNDKEIFKGSSSSNFFNNRNGGKETEDDYDDNVNFNQNNDQFQKKKLVRKQQRRPNQENNNQNQQNNNQNQQNRRRPQNTDNNQQTQEQNRRPAPQNTENNQQQNRRPVSQNTENNQQNRRPVAQNTETNQQNQQQNRRPVQNQQQNRQNLEAQTVRPSRPTGFVNNFAGSSYVPTTEKSTPPATYSVSTPQPFKQTQQFNGRSTSQNYNNGQYTTQAPQKETENYPANFPKQTQRTNYQNVGQRKTESYSTQAPRGQFSTNYDVPKVKTSTENYPSQNNGQYKPAENNAGRNQYNAPSGFNTNNQFEAAKLSSTTVPKNNGQFNQNQGVKAQNNGQFNQNQGGNNQNNGQYVKPQSNGQFNNNQNNGQYNQNQAPKSQNNGQSSQNQGTNSQNGGQYNGDPNTHYDIPKVKASQANFAGQNGQYSNFDAAKVKSNDNSNNKFNQGTFDIQKTKQTTQFKNDYSTQFNKKPTTPFKENNQPTTFAPKYNPQSNSYPSTFSPRTNSGYTQVSQQTTQYNSQNNQNSQQSTPKSTPFTQYTPTVPKISSTTPVSRSNRFDETQYDDGSYDPKYDRNEDEFLKTAHSQNIASSRNEYAKATKNVQSTQKPYYESPRPFSVSPNTPKVSDLPKSTPKPVNTPKPFNAPKQEVSSGKKIKDASYDYAYYDTNVGSEPEYEIDTEIKKSTVNN